MENKFIQLSLFDNQPYCLTKESIIKSPLYYSGSKHYIIDQIVQYLPKTISTFVDATGGGFNVGINIHNVKQIIYNEYNPYVFDMVDMLLNSDKEKLINDIENIIYKFELEPCNKEKYLSFRDYYNKHKSPLYLYVLSLYSFCHNLRFNNNNDFNMPVGNSGLNQDTLDRIRKFSSNCEIVMSNKSYTELDINSFDKDTLFYFDPPYLITEAVYNETGRNKYLGWDENNEKELLEFLSKIDKSGRKFLLSNVIYHKDKVNQLLLDWAAANNYEIIELNKYSQDKQGARNEVLIKNY